MNIKTLTTSKQLAWVIVIFYIIAFFSVEFAYIKYGKDLFQLYGSILPLPMTVIVSYFGKAGIENYYKITTAATAITNDPSSGTSTTDSIDPAVIEETTK